MVLVIYNDIENPLKYLISEDLDWLKFHNLVVNSGDVREEEFCDAMFDENEDHNYTWSNFNTTNCIDFSQIKHIVNVTWLP